MKTTYKFLSLLIVTSLLVPPDLLAEDDDVTTNPRSADQTAELTQSEIERNRAQADLARLQATQITTTRAEQQAAQARSAAATTAVTSANDSAAIADATSAAESPALNIINGGGLEGDPVAPTCLGSLQITDCSSLLTADAGGADIQTVNKDQKIFKSITQEVNFESPRSCAQVGTGQFAEGGSSDAFKTVKFNEIPVSRVCRILASSCKLAEVSDAQKPSAYEIYKKCVSAATKNSRAVTVGIKKCAAIQDAAASTTEFEAGEKAGGDPIVCKAHEGYAFDYPSCTNFLNWYMGLKATEMGLGIYNEADKTMTGMKAQNDMAKEIQQGNGQTAGLDGAKRTTMAAADAENRNKIFHTTKAGAIGVQLALFETRGSISGTCQTSCCELFKASGNDKIKTNFFPNRAAYDHMIAEVIKAGGQAAVAAINEAQLKKQASMMEAAKAQLAGPEDESEEGFMKFCQQYPQDVRCLGPGNRLSVGGNGYGSNFGGQNFGLGDLGAATTDDFNTETITPGSGPGTAAAAVGGVGNMNKAAAEAKDIFNAPPAARGGGGAPGAGGGAGGGGAGASASANGLSNDPGVQAEKKEDPLKVTSKRASYDGATGYSGGSWRDGGAKKEAGAENPFAAMFNKNKGRDIAAAKEIDSPASDLFTKISNRYGEVQKRKGLMQAADTNIR